ncbi:hypothetical protein LJC20_00415 [Eubacteriales bacterium OttesenSCG-928-M02]|nr:hypothetical protein [Eubacteriales bacterium OttesenSCG-928-M02]
MPTDVPRIVVTRESDSGRNENFKDTQSNRYMTRQQFVAAINYGSYDDYHVRNINGVDTPVSNPDGNAKNNLG